MSPAEVWFTDWVLSPGGRLEIYNSGPYNGYDEGSDCATLSLNSSQRITIGVDLSSAGDFESASFWVSVSPGEAFFFGLAGTSEDTWTVPEGTSIMSFDCTCFIKDSVTPTSGVLVVYVKQAETVLGYFKISYTVSEQTTGVTIMSFKDSYARELTPNSNYGTTTAMYVAAMESANSRTFVGFSLEGIPEGKVIKSARVYFMTGDTVGDFPREHLFSRVIEDWSELSITWNNQPSVTLENEMYYMIPYNSGGAPMDFDVTVLVQDAWRDGDAVFSLRIIDALESPLFPESHQMFYVPREGYYSHWHPRLEIEYADI